MNLLHRWQNSPYFEVYTYIYKKGVLGVLVFRHVFGEKICVTCDSSAKTSLKHFRGKQFDGIDQ